MLNLARVLIVEDEVLVACDLEAAVLEMEGMVLGPCSTIVEALEILERGPLPEAAILDFHLADGPVTPIAELLLAKGVPLVIHSATEVPSALRVRLPPVALCPKPTGSERVVRVLQLLIVGLPKVVAPKAA